MRIFTSFLLLLFLQNLTGQSLWQPATIGEIHLAPSHKKRAEPSAFRLLKLDYDGLVQKLAAAPMEFTSAAKTSPVLLELPVGEGRIEEFAVVLSPVMEPDFMTRWPKIRTFSGRGTRDKSLTVRLDHGYLGLHAMVMEAGGATFYVEPFANNNVDFYMAFDRKNATKPDHGGAMPTVAPNLDDDFLTELKKEKDSGILAKGAWLEDSVTLRSYRTAISAAAEYTEHFGSKPAALSAVVATMNQLSMIYERDIDIRFVLVAKEDTLIFEGFNDPFSSNDVTVMIGENTQIINQRIGFSGYDVGHCVTRFTGGGALGVGSLGSICGPGKGSGSTSNAPPEGDFFVAVLGQEIGHQFSGQHTFNYCGGNENQSTSYEPRCGSTIMSYSTWGPDLYMHNNSIEDIGGFSQAFGGNSCAKKIPTGNIIPTVEIPYPNNFSIPRGTPFDLTANASDPDGGTLSYCWEQFDTGPQVEDLAAPEGNCPLFRTYEPTASPTRIFPKLSKIVANNINPQQDGEVLAFYGRNATFRCTVRDNQPGGGGVAYDELEFKIDGTAGPFRVLSPNAAADKWLIGDFVKVQWDVAGSEKAPVNCKIVDLKLSLDGGFTYPITLAAGVANDGSHYVQVPDNPSTKARVMVHAADNIFFDISNVNFKIEAPTQPGWGAALASDSKQICLPGTFQTSVQTIGWQGFSLPISLSVESGLPAGATASFSKTSLAAGESADLTVDFSQVLAEGVWTATVKAATATDTLRRQVVFTTVSNEFSSLALAEPADGTLGTTLLPILKWIGAVDANLYDVQLATNPSFAPSTIVVAGNNLNVLETKPTSTLEYKTMYFWRIRAKNECAETAWSEPFVFATQALDCKIAEAQDLPKYIAASGTPEITSTITSPFAGTITDINVTLLQGNHQFFKDLDVRLVSPSGTEVQLWKSKCGNFNGNFKFGLDDEAPTAFICPPPNLANIVKDMQPVSPLAAFGGQSSGGVWTLKIKDQVSTSEGNLEKFALEFCGSVQFAAPFIVNNNVLEMPSPGVNAEVAPSFLRAEDTDNVASELVFTLVSGPKHGHLALNWGAPMQPGDRFTQTDIDAGGLRFFDYGGQNPTDKFSFVVEDGDGGFIPKTTFLIEKTVKTAEPAADKGPNAFFLAPNPTADATILTFEKPLATDAAVQIFDVDGRLARAEKAGAGAISLALETADLPAGLYLVVVRTAAGATVAKRLAVAR